MTEISCRDDDPRIAGHRRACNFAQPFGRHRIVGELARQQQTEPRGKTVMAQHYQIEKAAEHFLARRRRSASRRSVSHSLPSSAGMPRCREAAIFGAAKLISFMA